MKTIETKALRKRLESGRSAVFDVRGDIEYEIGHIPGAKTAPLGSLGYRVAHIMDPDSFVAVYSTGNDSLARQAAERLENLGMRDVHVYEEGLEGWKAAGLSVRPSPHAKVIARGPVTECRSIVVNREEAYGGAFKEKNPIDVDSAGG